MKELGCWGLGGALRREAFIFCCADLGEPCVCYAMFFILTIIAVRYRSFNDYSLFNNHSLVAFRGFGVWGEWDCSTTYYAVTSHLSEQWLHALYRLHLWKGLFSLCVSGNKGCIA